jgi:uncharacterized cupredoxin-like copper-binding protein
MPRRPLPVLALLAGVAMLASACVTPVPLDHATEEGNRPDPVPSPSPARKSARKPAPTWATGPTVRVEMNDRFRYRPAAIRVRAGRRLTFAVTNTGKLPHEFILGDRATQLDHERQMQAGAGGGHAHDHGPGAPTTPAASGALTVPPGQTKHLTWTFDKPGIVLYGCHVVGHWAAGMKGTIVVVPPAPPRSRMASSVASTVVR